MPILFLQVHVIVATVSVRKRYVCREPPVFRQSPFSSKSLGTGGTSKTGLNVIRCPATLANSQRARGHRTSSTEVESNRSSLWGTSSVFGCFVFLC